MSEASCLPVELVLLILDNLHPSSKQANIAVLAQTNKHWNQIVTPELWKRPNLLNSQQLRRLANALQLPHVPGVSFEKLYVQRFNFNIKNEIDFTKISSSILKICSSSRVDWHGVETIWVPDLGGSRAPGKLLARCPHLKEFRFGLAGNALLNDLARYVETASVESIELAGCRQSGLTKLMTALRSKSNHVKRLVIHAPDVSDNTFSLVEPLVSNLNTLKWPNCRQIQLSTLICILAQPLKLVNLDLSGITTTVLFSDAFMKNLTENPGVRQHLRTLNLNFIHRGHPDAELQRASYYRNIGRLSLTTLRLAKHFSCTSDAVFRCMFEPESNLKRLKGLDLHGCHLDKRDLQLISELSELEYLDLDDLCGVMRTDLDLLTSLRRLKVLDCGRDRGHRIPGLEHVPLVNFGGENFVSLRWDSHTYRLERDDD